jgi:hypothetical protein
MRYRIRTLLIAVVLAAVVCLALRAPSIWWSGSLFVALVLTWLTSILVAVYCSGSTRAMAIGFSVFSCGFVLVEHNFWRESNSALALPTDDLIRWSFDRIHKDHTHRRRVSAAEDPFAPNLEAQARILQFRAYKAICITTIAFTVGVLGSAIAQGLQAAKKPPNP